MAGSASRDNGKKGGRPKGVRNKATVDKELQREIIRAHVAKALKPMLDAQIANATGIKYLVVREKGTGKFVRVTEAMARVKATSSEEIIEVWEKDPSVQAFTDLLNRLVDKPKEQEQDINVNLSLDMAEQLRKARLRAHARNADQS